MRACTGSPGSELVLAGLGGPPRDEKRVAQKARQPSVQGKELGPLPSLLLRPLLGRVLSCAAHTGCHIVLGHLPPGLRPCNCCMHRTPAGMHSQF